MAADEQIEAHSTFGKVLFYATIVSGVVAADLMYRRGESMVSIARKTVTNPVGSMVSEVKNII
jgi:putative effector of murein hydrolase